MLQSMAFLPYNAYSLYFTHHQSTSSQFSYYNEATNSMVSKCHTQSWPQIGAKVRSRWHHVVETAMLCEGCTT